MKHIMSAFFIALTCGASAHAQTSVQMFPPVNCISNTLMYIAWDKESPTSCISGQDMLKNTLPSCSDGQAVVYDASMEPNGMFVCKTLIETKPVSTCADNEVLTYRENDTTKMSEFKCVANSQTVVNPPQNPSLVIPVCQAHEVLTSNGANGLRCVNPELCVLPPSDSTSNSGFFNNWPDAIKCLNNQHASDPNKGRVFIFTIGIHDYNLRRVIYYNTGTYGHLPTSYVFNMDTGAYVNNTGWDHASCQVSMDAIIADGRAYNTSMPYRP